MIASLLEGVNREVVAIFAALVLLEGLRRVPAGALVMRGAGPAGWNPLGVPEPRERWRLVSWWSPLAPALVLSPFDSRSAIPSATLESRLEAARRLTPVLAISAGFTLTALIFGLPIASARFGAVGFFAGVAAVLALALANAAAGALALRRLGAPTRTAQVLAWCSPFAAGRVLESVYEAALAGASQAQAVRALAGEETFARWSRPRAYDVVHGVAEDLDLRAAAEDRTLAAIIASQPSGGGAASFCPRCAATWRMADGECPACAVPLSSVTSA